MKKIDLQLAKYVTPHSLSIILTVIFLAGLIPVVMMAGYSYPGADDYSFASGSRQIWTETQNLFLVIGKAAEKTVTEYFEWTGCFSSTFFMALQPAVFGERWYFMTTVIMLSMLCGSTVYLFRVILVKGLKIEPALVHSVSMVTLLVLIQSMVGRREAFYWYNGSVHYIFLHSVGMFMLGTMISAAIAINGTGGSAAPVKMRRKIKINLAAAAVLGIIVGGGNYLTGLVVGIIMALMGVPVIWRKKWRRYKLLLLPAICYLTAFMINVLAPGNRVRADGSMGMNPFKAIMVSFHYVLEYALSDWTGWVVIWMVITLIPLFWKAASQTAFTFSRPLLVTVISLCLLAATITPPLYAIGNIGAGRLQALIYTAYILLLVLNVGYLTGWVQKQLGRKELPDTNKSLDGKDVHDKINEPDEKNSPSGEPGQFSPRLVKILIFCGAFGMLAAVLSIIPEPHYFTFTSAVADIANGRAARYRDAMAERAGRMNRAGTDEEVILAPLPPAPFLLSAEDITAQKDHWLNWAMAEYYGVAAVTVKEDHEN